MKKKIIFCFALFVISSWCFAQQQLFTNLEKDSVVRLDSRIQQFEFVPGEILIKFKDDVKLNIVKSNYAVKTGIAGIDDIFSKYSVTETEKLFPQAKMETSRQMLTTFNGQTFEKPSLHNIYKLKLPAEYNLFEVIESLKLDENVIYAEPNYLLSIVEDQPVSEVLTESDLKSLPLFSSPPDRETPEGEITTPNDPLYSQQWHIPAVHADDVWDTVTGDTTHVICILDTGVDWQHPDLQNKIWINPGEIPGNGTDDDGNGYVDDFRGWDWINNDNNPMDDNSHGTHVAGIAAAESNNGIGIAGINWGARIMPLKVIQSSGKGNIATICQGILYAVNQNATVINMSFGSYAYSGTLENTLANAYASSILVAAAGNDGIIINMMPFFPAALSYVLGTMAPGTYFSNFDADGPVYSVFPELFNYELGTPGTSMISTIPNGNYRVYQGTSMAAPVVSGAVCLYKSVKPDDSQELMWGNMINTAQNNAFIDVDSAIGVVPLPKLWFISRNLTDSLPGDDNDGLVDAGEGIELWFTIRNTWGPCDSVMVGIRFGEFEDTTVAQIINAEAFIGSTSPYALHSNEQNPLMIQIDEEVANDRDIVFEAYLWYPGTADTIFQELVLTVYNGTELSGVMDSTMVLDASRLWIVNNSFKIYGTLIIQPGVTLKLYQSFINEGNVIGIGTPDSTILIEGPGMIAGNGNLTFTYTKFLNINGSFGFLGSGIISFENCIFEGIYSRNVWDGFGSLFRGLTLNVHDCIIQYCSFSNLISFGIQTLNFKNNNVYRCYISQWGNNLDWWKRLPQGNNNFVNILDLAIYGNQTNSPLFMGATANSIHNNYISFGSPGFPTYAFIAVEGAIIHFDNQYWGTTDMNKIKDLNYDFWENPALAMYEYDTILTAPVDSAHAVVWKILVNGHDAQDEYVDPVGLGPQRFDVYFNREMDSAVSPQLSFGVRYPYTQQTVLDSSAWSADHKVWTAYKTVQLYTGDGINRLRVAAAKDLEGWEIPVEDQRFEFVISAAGSASVNFMATPGLGKVDLEWNNVGLEDLLGFNMYRFQHLTDTTFTLPEIVSDQLILDTLFTDFNVTPGVQYFYYYRVVRTDFSESDSSNIVSATPFTASEGDANGDLSVNVLDITSIISFILNQNPQPFIFEAADVNNDSQVNVLDIIGVIQLISGKSESISATIANDDHPAYIYLKDDKIQFKSDNQVAALQFELTGINLTDIKIISLLKGFEFSYAVTDDKITGILYNFSGITIPAGIQDILHIETNGAELDWGVVLAGDWDGNYVNVLKGEIILPAPEDYTFKAYPNPSDGNFTIAYELPETSKVRISIYSIFGQQIGQVNEAHQEPGKYEISWPTLNDINLSSGIYICSMQAINVKENRNIYTKQVKLIVVN